MIPRILYMNHLKNTKILITLLLSFNIFSINFIVEAGNKNKYPIEYPAESGNFIKRNFKPGKMKTIKAEILEKILPGMWSMVPPEVVLFRKDGSFQVMDYSYKYEVRYKGKWRAKNNTIAFKLDGAKEWQLCKILYVNYWTCMPKCEKGLSDQYRFDIILKEIDLKAEYKGRQFFDFGFSVFFN